MPEPDSNRDWIVPIRECLLGVADGFAESSLVGLILGDGYKFAPPQLAFRARCLDYLRGVTPQGAERQ